MSKSDIINFERELTRLGMNNCVSTADRIYAYSSLMMTGAKYIKEDDKCSSKMNDKFSPEDTTRHYFHFNEPLDTLVVPACLSATYTSKCSPVNDEISEKIDFGYMATQIRQNISHNKEISDLILNALHLKSVDGLKIKFSLIEASRFYKNAVSDTLAKWDTADTSLRLHDTDFMFIRSFTNYPKSECNGFKMIKEMFDEYLYDTNIHMFVDTFYINEDKISTSIEDMTRDIEYTFNTHDIKYDIQSKWSSPEYAYMKTLPDLVVTLYDINDTDKICSLIDWYTKFIKSYIKGYDGKKHALTINICPVAYKMDSKKRILKYDTIKTITDRYGYNIEDSTRKTTGPGYDLSYNVIDIKDEFINGECPIWGMDIRINDNGCRDIRITGVDSLK